MVRPQILRGGLLQEVGFEDGFIAEREIPITG
jgi:hypothetical protein